MDCLKERLLFDIDLYTKAMIRQYNSFFRPNDRPLYSSDLDVGFQIVPSNNKCGEVKIPSNHRFGSPLVSNSDYRVIPCFKIHYLCGFDIEALKGYDFLNFSDFISRVLRTEFFIAVPITRIGKIQNRKKLSPKISILNLTNQSARLTCFSHPKIFRRWLENFGTSI